MKLTLAGPTVPIATREELVNEPWTSVLGRGAAARGVGAGCRSMGFGAGARFETPGSTGADRGAGGMSRSSEGPRASGGPEPSRSRPTAQARNAVHAASDPTSTEVLHLRAGPEE